jgi:threonine dehydratase
MTAEAARTGARMIGPTEPELIAGVASYTLEIGEQLPQADVIVVPVGSGSGAAAVCLAGRRERPELDVVAVQAEAAPAAYLTWRHRTPTLAGMATEAEGLATRVPFANTQAVLRDPEIGVADFWLVGDDSMRAASLALLDRTHNLAELAGAAALAGVLERRDALAGKIVVVILSGGNLSVAKLQSVLSQRYAPA